MKTITIPVRFGYPTLDITINGKEQSFKSGEPITIEDNIAEAIENAIALAPILGVPRNKLARLAENSLKEITAEDLEGISAIARCAFYSNLGLINITIPNNIKSIGEDAFSWSVNLERVYLPEVPPTVDPNSFKGVRTTCVFYCKSKESYDAYKAATNWSTLTDTYTFLYKHSSGEYRGQEDFDIGDFT